MVSKNIRVDVKDVKYKGVIVKDRTKRRQKMADEANNNMKLVDEQVNLCESFLKFVEDFFDKNNKKIFCLDVFISDHPKIENESDKKNIYKLYQDLSEIVSLHDSEKAIEEHFKKELHRLETDTGTHSDSQKMAIRNFVTCGKFDEKTILSAMADTKKELMKSNDELGKIAGRIKSVLVTMLEAADEVEKLNKKNKN